MHERIELNNQCHMCQVKIYHFLFTFEIDKFEINKFDKYS